MAEPDPSRGEVTLSFAGEQIILRCSFSALCRMLPVLIDPPPEVAQRRYERLKVNQDAFRRELPPLEQWNWNQHLLGAVAAPEPETVARCITILAAEHHPEITFERVMEVSPGWAQIAPALSQIIYLHHYHPGEEPRGAGEEVPFGMIGRLYEMLARLRPSTASPPASSGA